jgi:hypothetical protein
MLKTDGQRYSDPLQSLPVDGGVFAAAKLAGWTGEIGARPELNSHKKHKRPKGAVPLGFCAFCGYSVPVWPRVSAVRSLQS